MEAEIYFLRDSNGVEIDLMLKLVFHFQSRVVKRFALFPESIFSHHPLVISVILWHNDVDYEAVKEIRHESI